MFIAIIDFLYLSVRNLQEQVEVLYLKGQYA